MLLLAISSLVIIISSGLHFSRGQTVEKALPDFNVYENADYKINIQYPKSWHVFEQDLAANVIVQFKARIPRTRAPQQHYPLQIIKCLVILPLINS